LVIAFTTAFIMRSYPAKYGFYLNEYDPYFNYRATKYIVDNGLDAYSKWHDTMSWYPEGRDIAKTSQSGLHIVTAFLYNVFGQGVKLLDFTIILPVILSSLTTIVIFAVVRTISGSSSAGLFASLLFAFSPFIIQRGNLGWFKSEPLGLFLGLLALYLFLSAIKYTSNNNKEIKYLISKSLVGGIILGLGNASWNGVQYFIIPISLFLIALPFIRKKEEIQNPMFVAVVFTVFTIITTAAFPRAGSSFLLSLPSIALIGGTVFLVISNFIKKYSDPRIQNRSIFFVLIIFILLVVVIIAGGLYYLPDKKYLAAVNPFIPSHPFAESVAENIPPRITDYFIIFSTLLIFSGIGTWLALKRKDDMSIFALIIGITGIYVSTGSLRLLVFASIGIIILAAIGLRWITRIIPDTSKKSLPTIATTNTTITKTTTKIKQRKFELDTGTITRIAYTFFIIFLLFLPMVYPRNLNWISYSDIPPTIINGGTGYSVKTYDWINALNWISKNTPKDAVIAAWWDYGYWISTLGNRTTLADNAANNQTRIATISQMFMEKPEEGIRIANKLKADYILIYVVAEKIAINNSSYYILGSGGDESKIYWFIKLGKFDENKYIEDDQFTPKPIFWNNSLLGQLIPFEHVGYATKIKNGQQLTNFSQEYKPEAFAIYSKHMKYQKDNSSNHQQQQPLSLVYHSDSFAHNNNINNNQNLISTILVYKINSNQPSQRYIQR
jgi:dolichyl-diphosphooligosaccharide--protein glycosyltransferase